MFDVQFFCRQINRTTSEPSVPWKLAPLTFQVLDINKQVRETSYFAKSKSVQKRLLGIYFVGLGEAGMYIIRIFFNNKCLVFVRFQRLGAIISYPIVPFPYLAFPPFNCSAFVLAYDQVFFPQTFFPPLLN